MEDVVLVEPSSGLFLLDNEIDHDPNMPLPHQDPDEFYFQLLDDQGNMEPEICIDDSKDVVSICILPTEPVGYPKLEVERKIWYKCSACRILVDNPITLSEHISKHVKSEDIRSGINQIAVEVVLPIVLVSRCECDESLSGEGMNNNSISSLVLPNPELTCSVCNQRMSTKDSLRRHMMRHTGEKPYACHICKYRAIQKTHLKAHIFYNHGENQLKTGSLKPEFVPSIYKKVTKEKLEGKEEAVRRQVYPFGPFWCDRCNVGFRKKDNLQRHTKKYHYEDPDIPHPIVVEEPVIPKPQKTLVTVKQTNTLRSTPPQLRIPSFSSSNSSSPLSLLAYVRCPVCAKLVSSNNKLENHMLTHAGVKPYACAACGKTFQTKKHLKRHIIRIHDPSTRPDSMPHLNVSAMINPKLVVQPQEPGRSYPCATCDKTFKRQTNLSKHISRFHSSLGIGTGTSRVPVARATVDPLRSSADKYYSHVPAKCLVCFRVLSNSDTLRRHMLIHQGIKPFACEFCFETFRQKHHVQAHVKRHHTRNYTEPVQADADEDAGPVSSSSVAQVEYKVEVGDQQYKIDIDVNGQQSSQERLPNAATENFVF